MGFEKAILKAYRDLDAADKAMEQANFMFTEAQKRRNEVVEAGTKLACERRQLQQKAGRLGGGGYSR